MRPETGEVLHFSEDPDISEFRPHVAATAKESIPYVWAVDHELAPAYWFPRPCPRVLAWSVKTSTEEDRDRLLGPGGGHRVHAIEHGWLSRMLTTKLYAYRLPATSFRPIGAPAPHALVSTEVVEPICPPVLAGNLIDLHQRAGIQLRVLTTLWDFWDAVVTSSLGYSGIRLKNALERRV